MNRTVFSLLWCAFVACHIPDAHAQSLPDWTTRIRTDHPRLFFNADTWPAVRQRASSAEAEWYEQLKGRVDRQELRIREVAQIEASEQTSQATWEVRFNTSGGLAGRVRHEASGKQTDHELTANVTSQSGLMIGTQQKPTP